MEHEQKYYAEFLVEIDEKLEAFLSNYEYHTRSYSVSSCLSLSLSASQLNSAIMATKQVLAGVLLLSSHEKVEADTYKLDLYLSNVTSLHDFANKLNALADIYSELLSLYGASEGDNPIIIEHLESGSLWIKVAGHKLTSVLLTSVLTSSIIYYQNNFTTTGQLNQLPAAVKTVDDLLMISKKLEADGVDTAEIKDNIESATRKISKKLDVLLGDQPVIEINDSEHSVGELLSEKLIEQSKTLKLEHQADLD